ncbi:helicase-associated domain-containing protein [Paenibacillus amylolyticus]|uniref:helicase-associated domain-containing protein n=1 Tax=Paenibacillus amylolyticus TaxID=1451 RepID=UPI003EBDB3F5
MEMSDLELGMEKVMQSRMMMTELEGWSALTLAEQRVLGALFHKYAGQTFSSLLPSEEWAKEGLSGAEAKLAFAMLRRKQWIKSVYKSWGERSFYIPKSHHAMLTLIYSGRIGCVVEAVVGSVRHVFKEGKPHIAGELLHLLAWIQREGLPLTGKGTIHKRSILKLSALTILSQDDFEDLEITYDHKELYPVHVIILLDLLLCLHLVQKTDRGFEIRQDKFQQWIKLSWTAMHVEIFQVCMDRYVAAGSELQHFRYQLALLAPGKNQWCRVLKWQENAGVRSWLFALAGWGFGEVGEDENGELAFRWLIHPGEFLIKDRDWVNQSDSMLEQEEREFSRFYVQPDFEVMVPPDVSAEVCWRLELYSERVTRDQMSIYRLCKERMETAVASGVKWESIADFLERHGQGELPGHVLAALKNWARASEVMPDRKLSLPLAWDAETLDNSGKPEKQKEENSVQVSPSLFYNSEIPGLIQVHPTPGMTEDHEDVESDWDHDVNGKAAWNQRKADVPETWHRDWRRYHMSTARQIAAQAIEWQVKLGIREGEETFVLIPHQVEGHEQWTLEGWCILNSDEHTSHTEWRTFIPDRWDTMRLLLPEDV